MATAAVAADEQLPTAAAGARPAIIAPSVLACDFACLAAESRRVVDCGADWLHLDVMDGNFVPNLTFGPPVIECLRKHTDAFFDCHVMVTRPEDYVEALAKTGANSFTFHLEATQDPLALVKQIKAAGLKAAVAVSPHVAVEDVFPLVEADTPVDMVLVMTVKPGFGGQKFMPDMMPKVAALRQRYPNLDIQVDGGLSAATVDTAAAAGANVIVAGTAVFAAADPQAVIAKLRQSVHAGGSAQA